MPGTTAFPDEEIIIEDIGGGGGGPPPPPGGGDDGDGGGDDRNRRRKWTPSPKRYSTAITIGIVSILMFFMALASAFIVLRRSSDLWVTVHLPRILWANTCVLLASSFTLESAPCFLLGSANLKKQKSRFRQPRKSPLTTGISWMDFGFSCWPCFTWASEILVARKI